MNPWVGDEGGRFIESGEVENLRVVGDLIDVDKMKWRTNLLDLHFNERDKRCILAIPLSSRGGNDKGWQGYTSYTHVGSS